VTSSFVLIAGRPHRWTGSRRLLVRADGSTAAPGTPSPEDAYRAAIFPRRIRRVYIAFVGMSLAGVLALAGFAPTASAHRNACHSAHRCPSDHATYRWGPQRLLCVKPTSEKRTARFKIRVRHAGLTYWCRR